MTVSGIEWTPATWGAQKGDPPKPTTSAASTGVTKNMFLQLMVAQLKNQDPMKPSDSTAFVGQLAQFQQLETSLNSSQDITAIRDALTTLVAQADTSKTSST